MSRSLTILFRRDRLRDHQSGNVDFEGYQVLWPDAKPVACGLDAFCKQGQRLLGLGKHLAGCDEKLVKLICIPLSGREDDLNRVPGARVRRFYIERDGNHGQTYYMDGTPTVASFDLIHDDPRVLFWLGLNSLQDGDVTWFDIAAVPLEAASPAKQYHRKRQQERIEAQAG